MDSGLLTPRAESSSDSLGTQRLVLASVRARPDKATSPCAGTASVASAVGRRGIGTDSRNPAKRSSCLVAACSVKEVRERGESTSVAAGWGQTHADGSPVCICQCFHLPRPSLQQFSRSLGLLEAWLLLDTVLFPFHLSKQLRTPSWTQWPY